MMRPVSLALLISACALAACRTPPPPPPPAPVPQPSPSAQPGDEQDPNLKALPTAPIGRQSLPPPAPR